MKKRLTKREWEKQKRVRVITILSLAVVLAVFVLGLFCLLLGSLFNMEEEDVLKSFLPTKKVEETEIIKNYLTPNPYSRPQTPLKKVKGVVIHYTANPGTDAEANRNYFENLKNTKATSVSSHFIIGLDGTIIQTMPLDEIAYASNERNEDTISIESCHKDETGKFTAKTYQSLVELTAWLCGEYNLKSSDILRHYDITGKDCPRYYVANEKKWEAFKEDVFSYIESNGKK